MNRVPRLLPIVAVAIGGVLAIKALSGVQALQMLSPAQADAEEAPKAGAAKAAAKPAPLPVAAAPKPPPACAISPAELAREAGLSPGELQTLQNLQSRRGQLDDRERALDTQIQLLAAAEAKVDGKLKAMTAVKAQIQALLGQTDQQQQNDVDRLVLVYQKMKPADAAAVMATLDDKVRVPVAAKMKDAALAAILGKMPTVEAKKLTESLAQRGEAAKAAARAAEQAPVQAAAAAPVASPDPTAPEPAAVAKAKPKAKSKTRKVASVVRKTPHAAAADALVPGTPVDKPAPAKATAAAVPAPAPAKKPAPPTPPVVAPAKTG